MRGFKVLNESPTHTVVQPEDGQPETMVGYHHPGRAEGVSRGAEALCSNLRRVCEQYIRKNAEWRERLQGLLQEHARLEREQQALLEAALQRLDLTVGHSVEHAADLRGLVANYERTLIAWALASAGGQQNRAAALLGIGPTTLNEKLKRLHIAVRGEERRARRSPPRLTS